MEQTEGEWVCPACGETLEWIERQSADLLAESRRRRGRGAGDEMRKRSAEAIEWLTEATRERLRDEVEKRRAEERCGRVVDNDDSIGGEGEIVCGAPMLVKGDEAICANDHRWIACHCGGATCRGWKIRSGRDLNRKVGGQWLN